MKFTNSFYTAILFSQLLVSNPLLAQNNNCIYKDPVFTLNFGTLAKDGAPTLYNLKNYNKTTGSCPNDGFYSFTTATNNCFAGKWHSLPEDHTPGDVNGKMMIVNAAEKPGDFFALTVTGLTPGAQYRVSAWFANICKYASGCVPTPPVIEITVHANDKIISSFKTGEIKQTDVPTWQNYTGEFVMVANTDVISLQMKDLTPGGCGNDFALDDIEINLCSQPIPVTTTETTAPIQQIFVTPVPNVIKARANPIIKQITTEETELTIELYDNGEIDGDTVSIYHNNELVVSHAGISTKPVTLKLKVDKANPHHELVMVADNLGRIPPNTSLMVITAGKKRYEVFISSSEQKNAKVLIDLQ
ncbi:MAG: hypothetical protein IPN43_14090 [Chitinophagaceae bacterium]|nr:hypothetical protein [Chitinophagaceae bacterium]